MADVLIVCVREDEPQAKALADMFEAAGFSVGGAPSNDSGLRSSGAGVIVWSRSSIRSRPFLDASQRVVNAGKAVIASLIEPPPPASVGDALTFDLSSWNGDAEDPQLDPLFFAVDRMVNSARAAVGAAPAQPAPQAFEPPPSLRPPPSAPRPAPRAPPPPPAAAVPNLFQTRSNRPDGLNSEAEHWRAIRDSKNPADFMDYIARYGADGAFTEVAELKLKQLTAQPTTPSNAPLRDAARAAAIEPARAPARNYDPPPPRRMEPPPIRRPDPPPVRREPAPAVRREPMFDRAYERNPPPLDPRDTPRSGGGMMRILLMVVLLGGGALGAGLYFGNTAPTPAGSEIAAPSDNAPADAYTAETGSPDGVGVTELAEQAPAPRQTTRPAPTRQERTERASATQDPEPPTPTPTTSWSPNGGPVSLQAGAQQTASVPTVTVPLAPPIEAPTQQASTTQPATPAVTPTVTWAQRPSADRISALYPPRAMRNDTGGRAVLDCIVQPALTLSCVVASETPANAGFGRAAMLAAGAYRAQPTRTDGSSAVGSRARVAITFRPPVQ
jgi:protein TonB